jgi:hypothetical protein
MMMHQLPEEPSAPAVEEVNENYRKPAKKQGKTKKNKTLKYLIPFRSFLNGIF